MESHGETEVSPVCSIARRMAPRPLPIDFIRHSPTWSIPELPLRRFTAFIERKDLKISIRGFDTATPTQPGAFVPTQPKSLLNPAELSFSDACEESKQSEPCEWRRSPAQRTNRASATKRAKVF